MRQTVFDIKKAVIQSVLRGHLTLREAAQRLGKSLRSVQRYVRTFIDRGSEGLVDHRRSNFQKLAGEVTSMILQAKLDAPWRSARKIRDLLGLRVSRKTVWRVLRAHDLNRTSLPPVKPVQRFVAPYPKALWQADIMGKATFCGRLDYFLIAVVDDHSRFGLAGEWCVSQQAMYVFVVLHDALARDGVPERILSDRGNQVKSTHPAGMAWWEHFLRVLTREPVYAQKAQTKGKIERFFRFVQQDVVLEHRQLADLTVSNRAFHGWLEHEDNAGHRSEALGGQACPADVYRSSPRKASPEDLEMLLIHEDPRKVRRDGYISFYGQVYRVPDRSINRRVFVQLRFGQRRLFVESGGEIDCRSSAIPVKPRQLRDHGTHVHHPCQAV